MGVLPAVIAPFFQMQSSAAYLWAVHAGTGEAQVSSGGNGTQGKAGCSRAGQGREQEGSGEDGEGCRLFIPSP